MKSSPERNTRAENQGLVFDLQRFSVHDGPGIRTLVFLQGCPLRCQWCANPESQFQHPALFYSAPKCLGLDVCGLCLTACPVDAVSAVNGAIEIDRTRCTRCEQCQEVCYAGALQLAGREMSVAEVMAEVMKDAVFYRHSGGGVTLSGGEPLQQPDFTLALLRALQTEGLHTALETCGFAPWPLLQKLLAYTDTLLYDIKHLDPEKSRAFTGQDNALILENARRAAPIARRMIVRFPVVPDFNDDPAVVQAVGQFTQDIGLDEMHLLPYHRLGTSKYRRLDREYALPSLKPPTEEAMARLKALLEELGLRVRIGG